MYLDIVDRPLIVDINYECGVDDITVHEYFVLMAHDTVSRLSEA